jgi:hypothetical protein
MTRLEQAVAKARELPQEQQDALAQLILEEIEADSLWEKALARSPEKLATLADKASADHEAGRTLPLDPDAL